MPIFQCFFYNGKCISLVRYYPRTGYSYPGTCQESKRIREDDIRRVSHFTLKVVKLSLFFFALQTFKRSRCARTNTRIGRKKERGRTFEKHGIWRSRKRKDIRRTFGGFSRPARFCSFCVSATGIHAHTALSM